MLATGLVSGRAVILFGTGDPARNTTEPTGALAGSGWQHQAQPGFCATMIGPFHAVTAAHLGLVSNSVVNFDGLAYRVVEAATAPGSDLRLLRLGGRIGRWAELNRGTNEAGQGAVLFGQGAARGAAVFADGISGQPELRGWYWGNQGYRLRWGTNVVREVTEPGEAGSDAYVVCWFDADAGDDEASVSSGDSGGGLFLRGDDGQWRLGGVAHGVEARFNTTTEGDGFFAALFNRRGFFQRDGDEWVPAPEAFRRPQTRISHTRISTYVDWLEERLAAPRPAAEVVPRLLSAGNASGPFAEHPAYAVDLGTRTVRANVTAQHRFFRLEGVERLSLQELGAAQITFGF